MALAFTDGVPGREAIWYWTSGHRTAPQATLNDGAATPSRVIFEDAPGLSGRPDVEDQRSKKLGRHGELLGPAYESGRTIAPPGVIQAKTALDLRKAEYTLDLAFNERKLEGTMKLWLPGADLDEDPFWAFAARVLAFDPNDQQNQGDRDFWPFQRSFTLAFRCSDPRIYFSEAITDTDATSVTLTNPGRDVDPLIVCTVDSAADLTITNESTDRSLKVKTSELTGTKVISFNFDQRLIWANDVGDTPFEDGEKINRLWLSDESDWWDPGEVGIDLDENVISQTGGDDITVVFYPCL